MLVPALYVVVIAALLYLQFGGRTSTRESVGSIEITASVQKNLVGQDRLRSLRVRYGPLRFSFSSGAPVSLRDDGGGLERLRAVEYRTTAAGLLVMLGNRVQLSLEADSTRLRVLAVPTDSTPAQLTISLPYSLEPRAQVAPAGGIPLLRVVEAGCTTYLSAGENGELDLDQASTRLAAAPEATLVLSAERCSTVQDPYQYWFSQVPVASDEDAYGAAVEQFLAASYASWQRELARPEANVIANDALLTAYLTEALARGALPGAVAALQPRAAGALAGGALSRSISPAVFLGMPQAYLTASRDARAESTANIAARIAADDALVFRLPGLVAAALSHGTPSWVERLDALAAEAAASPATTSPEVLLDVARFYVDLDAVSPPSQSRRTLLAGILTAGVVPALRRTERGVFFLSSPGTAEPLERTLVAGRLLLDAGDSLGDDSLLAVGRMCIVSALALSSPEAVLPSAFRLEGQRLIPSPQPFAPERAYELLARDRYFPSERALGSQVQPGASLLTAARIVELGREDSTVRLLLSFPVQQSHYVILQGIGAISQLQMHGIPWRPDPEYYRYSDGWWYDQELRTLYLKCTHQRETEELLLSLP